MTGLPFSALQLQPCFGFVVLFSAAVVSRQFLQTVQFHREILILRVGMKGAGFCIPGAPNRKSSEKTAAYRQPLIHTRVLLGVLLKAIKRTLSNKILYIINRRQPPPLPLWRNNRLK
jgi:hypothetical protein